MTTGHLTAGRWAAEWLRRAAGPPAGSAHPCQGRVVANVVVLSGASPTLGPEPRGSWRPASFNSAAERETPMDAVPLWQASAAEIALNSTVRPAPSSPDADASRTLHVGETPMQPPRMTHAMSIGVADRVTFPDGPRTLAGYVVRKGRTTAHVVTDDGQEFLVPYRLLSRVVGASRKPVEGRTDALRAQFQAGDRVRFGVGPEIRHGTISRLNPASAHVVCDDNREYRVAYAQLQTLERWQDARPSSHQHPAIALGPVAARARALLAAHGLEHWSFQFDHATKRAGCCNYRHRVISLAYAYARSATDEAIEDTILHEIAHALVGKDHGHNAVWRAQARAIGCSGARCHDVQFTPPRYIVTCEQACWVTTAERRKRDAVCRTCHGQVFYTTYTEERWQRASAKASGDRHTAGLSGMIRQ